jgi:uncharacterized membrane protein (DUF441 family)
VKGKRTYIALAGVLVSVAISVAARHGLDLGPYQQDLTDGLVLLFTMAAGYFRSVAHSEA